MRKLNVGWIFQLKNEQKATLWTILWIVLIAFGQADDSCPNLDSITPCTCDREGMNCMRAKTLDQVKKAFRADFKYGQVRSVWLQGTPIAFLPSDTFGSVKSQNFFVEMNAITNLDLNAFSGSKSSALKISLYGNKIKDVDYSPLSSFEVLENFNLGQNEITSPIPENAFKSKTLSKLILSRNKIPDLGKKAFSALSNLENLQLERNLLTTLGPLSLEIKTNSNNLQINLKGNEISSINRSAFQGTKPQSIDLGYNKLKSLSSDVFQQLIQRMPKGGFIDVSGNSLTCIGCDYSWIVDNKTALSGTLRGFKCTDGKKIEDLTYDNIECF